MTKYVIDLPDNVSFIVGKGYVLFNEKEFLRIQVKQLEKYSKKEDVEAEKNEKIIYDGRKEEKMSDKYVVSQKFMNALKEWKAHGVIATFVNGGDLSHLPLTVYDWWVDDISDEECNNRLIAIIRWMNSEDVFEVEKPKKWVVRSKEGDALGRYGYLDCYDYAITENTYKPYHATKFDTKEEAESWANSHQEVVEVEE